MDEINPFFLDDAMYVRKSRAEEGEDTEVVLARHKAQLTKYAAEHHVNVTHIYEEVVSGDSLFARPQMVELLHAIEDGKYTGVLCMDIDRLGRGNMKEQGLILETLKDAGTAIITPEHIYDLNNELDETATEFKTFMARQELKIIKKRLNSGRRITLEKGGYISNIPFGYIRAYKDKIPTLAPDPEEAEYVKMIFQWYIEGEGCPSICHKLTAIGVKPPRGEVFNRNSIRKIITNPVYIGKIVWGQRKYIRPKKIGEKHKTIYLPHEQWLLYDGLHPAIIDEDTFNHANAILAGRYHPPYMFPDKIVNPLAGILYCRQCGHTMTLMNYGSRKYQTNHMLCATTGCVRSSRADYVEKALLAELQLALEHLEFEQSTHTEGPDTQQAVAMLESMRAEHAKLLNQRNQLYDFVERGVYTVAVFSEREQIISRRIEDIARDIKTMDRELNARQHRAETVIPQIHHVLQEYWHGNARQKNQLLKSVIDKAYYFKTKDASPRDFSIQIILRDDALQDDAG